jgi:hypothetical protein
MRKGPNGLLSCLPILWKHLIENSTKLLSVTWSNIEEFEEEKTTASGLIIPDAAAEKPLEGVIVAIGNGKKNDHGEKYVGSFSLLSSI